MGEKLSRREFVKGTAAAVAGAIAAAALSGSKLDLVRRATRSLRAKAAAAEDPDPDPEPLRDDLRERLIEAYVALDPGRREFVLEVAQAMAADALSADCACDLLCRITDFYYHRA